MPKVNGLDLLKAIKSARPRLPVIIMTAYDRKNLYGLLKKYGLKVTEEAEV